jgi:ABC-type amino acid transport substrate-binding protein
MKFSQILLVIVISIAAAFATVEWKTPAATTAEAEKAAQSGTKETRWEQIKRTGILRCGYTTWPPYITKDVNTGEMSGLDYDLAEEMARQLNIKIEWAGEAATGTMLSDLAMNRYDAICTNYGVLPGRIREASFTTAFIYLPAYLYVRKDDTRFDNDLNVANSPDIKLAALDGEFSSIGAAEGFPQSSRFSMPQLTTAADQFMAVAAQKADGVIQDPFVFELYDKANPNQLKPAGNKMVRVVACGFPIPANEPQFKQVLDDTLAYLQDNGFIEKLMKKYEGDVKFVRRAKNYAE